ncbi:MAG TPA: hypothetical protein VHI93_01865 [Candidatus Thermoplasmatota archaeon]|nr:hypothetical protein [Candidatus Thermoplasmatota archaeon]
MALAPVAPLGTAHLTNPDGSWTSGLFTQGKVCRYGGSVDEGSNNGGCDDWLNAGVSGTYVGPSGLEYHGDLFPLEVEFQSGEQIVHCPLGYCATASMLCEMEVLSDGSTDNGNVQDEQVVDNDATAGWVPDGTWDDGGFGGACHTGFFARDNPACTIDGPAYNKETEANECASFNTYGCHGFSHAQDLLSDHHVWIMPTCDSVATVTDSWCNPGELLLAGGSPKGCVADVDCIVFSGPGCNVATIFGCGADGTADAVNLGQGGGHSWGDDKKFPAGLGSNKKETHEALVQGVPYPPVDDGVLACEAFATAATFVVTGVEVKVGSLAETAINFLPDGDGKEDLIQPFDGNDQDHTLVSGVGRSAASLLRTIAGKDGELDPADPVLRGLADMLANLSRTPSIKYSLATAGWIDWTNGGTDDTTFDGKGINFNVPCSGVMKVDSHTGPADCLVPCNPPPGYHLMAVLKEGDSGSWIRTELLSTASCTVSLRPPFNLFAQADGPAPAVSADNVVTTTGTGFALCRVSPSPVTDFASGRGWCTRDP